MKILGEAMKDTFKNGWAGLKKRYLTIIWVALATWNAVRIPAHVAEEGWDAGGPLIFIVVMLTFVVFLRVGSDEKAEQTQISIAHSEVWMEGWMEGWTARDGIQNGIGSAAWKRVTEGDE